MSLTRDDWLSLESFKPSDSALNALLAQAGSGATQNEYSTVIAGGGLAGLLAALRLSRVDSDKKLLLLESRATLGGRLFQSPPAPSGQTRLQVLAAQFSQDALQYASGPGFELFDSAALDVYERHTRMNLSEAETEFIDAFVAERFGPAAQLVRKTVLVRKEFTGLTEALSGSSEMLTKKEAETLLLMSQNEDIQPENDGPFETSSFWTGLPKNQKESLTPLLDTILGWPLDRTPSSVVYSAVRAFAGTHDSTISSWFARRSRLELALEVILLARGVDVRTQAELIRAVPPERKGEPSRIQVADLFEKAPRQYSASNILFAVPLMKTLTIFSREQLHAQQSKIVARHRPRSLVWVEYDGWMQALLQNGQFEWLTEGVRLICPVERVQGACLSHGRLGFFTSIDYEDSLHAQSVREALNRCRKAAMRLLSEPHMKAAQQARPAAPGIKLMRERIGLMPVGYNLPRNETVPQTTEIRMSPQGWYSAGDHFTFGPESWRNVIDSCHETLQLIAKGK
jgi:hypothetical protein